MVHRIEESEAGQSMREFNRRVAEDVKSGKGATLHSAGKEGWTQMLERESKLREALTRILGDAEYGTWYLREKLGGTYSVIDVTRKGDM